MVGNGDVGRDLMDVEVIEHTQGVVKCLDGACGEGGQHFVPGHGGRTAAHSVPGLDVQIVLRHADLLAMQILGIVVGTGAADHLTHSIIEHANAVIAGGCQGLVKQLQTAIFKGALHPVLIGGVQVG